MNVGALGALLMLMGFMFSINGREMAEMLDPQMTVATWARHMAILLAGPALMGVAWALRVLGKGAPLLQGTIETATPARPEAVNPPSLLTAQLDALDQVSLEMAVDTRRRHVQALVDVHGIPASPQAVARAADALAQRHR
jgi:hypothetical protein